MAATLTIDRSNLSLADLVIGVDTADGYTLDPAFSMGSLTWRKGVSEQSNVPGRTMSDYTRDTMTVTGSITCHGASATDLRSKIGTLVTALTQTAGGFEPFTMTYAHDSASYQWTCTEPADIVPGGADATGGALNDAEMSVFVQSFSFSITRHPIPLAGPI